MEEKDYYAILGVNPGSSTEDIKQAYRREALMCHPDRNPGDHNAEERFKLISEAYAVLTDPMKRLQYDRSRRPGPRPRSGYRSQTSFNQEEILREFFSSGRSEQAFKDLAREFERFGLRLDEKFINRLFSGSGKWFAGGFFFMGSFSIRNKQNNPFSSVSGQAAATDKLKSRQPLGLGRLVTGLVSGLKGLATKALPVVDYDINYNLNVSEEQARTGAKVTVTYDRDGRFQTVRVTIPPGTKDKARLRMKGMGHERPEGDRGNLFLNVRLSA